VLYVLFAMSLGLLGLFLYFAFAMSRESDTREGAKGLSNNQWRLAAWIFAIFVALAAAVVEFFVVVRK